MLLEYVLRNKSQISVERRAILVPRRFGKTYAANVLRRAGIRCLDDPSGTQINDSNDGLPALILTTPPKDNVDVSRFIQVLKNAGYGMVTYYKPTKTHEKHWQSSAADPKIPRLKRIQ
jgi:hypothetical protein